MDGNKCRSLPSTWLLVKISPLIGEEGQPHAANAVSSGLGCGSTVQIGRLL